MTDQIQLYFAIIQRYFGLGIAAFVALQPLLILITSAAHAIEVQGRNHGWARVQACGYWVAKVCGTFSTVDMRNVQRAGNKAFIILAEVITAILASKAVKKIDVPGAVLLLACSSLLLPLCTGCTSLSLHTTVEKALVFEQQVGPSEPVAPSPTRRSSPGLLAQRVPQPSPMSDGERRPQWPVTLSLLAPASRRRRWRCLLASPQLQRSAQSRSLFPEA